MSFFQINTECWNQSVLDVVNLGPDEVISDPTRRWGGGGVSAPPPFPLLSAKLIDQLSI